MEAYKKVVQVPIYEKNQRPYYKQPMYINTNTPSTQEMILNAPSLNTPGATKLSYENVVIKNLEPILADIDTDMYAKQNVRSIQETQVTKNDAYLNYALKFNVEILTQEQIDALPA